MATFLSGAAAGLFARENSAAINAASQQRLLDTNTKSSVAVYQNTLKQQWDSLSGESQAAWNDRAEAEAGNVLSKCLLSLAADTLKISFRNQQEFIETMSMALQDLCQGGLLGDSEMILWYAFREVGNDDLRAGTIHAHSAHNQVRFGAGQEDLHSQYEKAWWHFADDSIPRNVPVNTSIPRNSADQPVFPAVDLNTVSMADMRTLLGDYFDQCWAHRGVDNKATLIPWEKLVSEPGKYHDTQGLSIKLNHPQNLSAIEVLTLAQCLLSTSSINSPTPFRFLDPEEELLVHSNPASPPESPPRQSLPPGSPPKSSASPAHNLQKSLSPPPPTIVEQAPKSPAFRRETSMEDLRKSAEKLIILLLSPIQPGNLSATNQLFQQNAPGVLLSGPKRQTVPGSLRDPGPPSASMLIFQQTSQVMSGEPPSRSPSNALPTPPILPVALPVTGLPGPVPETGT
ncbi:hypothetical protein B0H19DRAFT_1275003 [Mycena capillaripes]|nr:hypothetical protein B0H19DRAFT_1275003 [Mycena capillaripes]